MMRHVDLCSGIGGFSLGFEWAGLSSPVLFCDIEEWSRKILAKHWPDVPIAKDVKELANDPDGLVPDCDILTAGYPCQPFSLAGERRGREDDRHIWPYILSIVKAKRPTWCVYENVYGHVTMGLSEVLSDLEGEGYASRAFVVPACAVDAPHRRDRVWIIARNVGNAISSRQSRNDRGQPRKEPENRREDVANASRIVSNGSKSNAKVSEKSRRLRKPRGSGSADDVAHTNSARLQGQWREHEFVSEREAEHSVGSGGKEIGAAARWKPEPAVGRVANGIPRRVDRLKGLGNAIVPQIAMRIGLCIKEAEKTPSQETEGFSNK